MTMGKKKPNDKPVIRVKTSKNWESFSIGLIIGMTFAFITFSVGYYTNV
jgi:hypothetical protein